MTRARVTPDFLKGRGNIAVPAVAAPRISGPVRPDRLHIRREPAVHTARDLARTLLFALLGTKHRVDLGAIWRIADGQSRAVHTDCPHQLTTEPAGSA